MKLTIFAMMLAFAASLQANACPFQTNGTASNAPSHDQRIVASLLGGSGGSAPAPTIGR